MFLNINTWMKEHLPQETKKIAVAVSGGADSLCLTHLLKKWCDENGVILFAYTVDHGLRRESAAEAKAVHQLLVKWKIKHRILVWEGKKPKSHIEECARSARYDLLYKAVLKDKIQYLFLAHHIEDQAETFWMRFAHGSGVDGLAAMDHISSFKNIFLMRPLLKNSKKEIISYLNKNSIQWFEDGMNQDESFERVYWRKSQDSLSQMGLDPENIYRLTERMKQTRAALDFYTNSFIKSHVFISPLGYAFIQNIAWSMIPSAIQLRVLQFVMPLISGDNKIISLEGLERLLSDPRQNITFGGCQFVRNTQGLYIAKEFRTPILSGYTKPKQWFSWDRFQVITPSRMRISCLEESPFKNIPTLIQKTFPSVVGEVHYSIDSSAAYGIYVQGMPVFSQKELEKKAFLDYKKGKKTIYIHFHPGKTNEEKNFC